MSRNSFALMWKNFLSSLRRGPPTKTVGEDYLGTKYFEIPPDPTKYRRQKRWFEPRIKENTEQELPPEWEAWLRYRRRDPPTAEEIERNRQIQMQTIKNARLLEEKEQKERAQLKLANPEMDATEDLKFPDLPYEVNPGKIPNGTFNKHK